jgi:hypothetical protein
MLGDTKKSLDLVLTSAMLCISATSSAVLYARVNLRCKHHANKNYSVLTRTRVVSADIQGKYKMLHNACTADNEVESSSTRLKIFVIHNCSIIHWKLKTHCVACAYCLVRTLNFCIMVNVLYNSMVSLSMKVKLGTGVLN